MVSHYRVVDHLGSGGMGDVYLAEDSRLNRKVALKFLPLHVAADVDIRRRFLREAQAAALLNHPNVVTVYEVGEHEGRPFLAMELVEGQSLKDFARNRELSVEGILDLALQIADGLAAAHAHQVVHRDVKPSNIMIDAYGRPRILDFGLATFEGGEDITRTGSTMGTVQYMSPEQVQGHQADYRSDLFSFGVMLYELLAGKNPFLRSHAMATGQAILTTTPEPLESVRSDLPALVPAIVVRLLEKSPASRYQSALEVVGDLKRVLREVDPDSSTRTYVSGSSLPKPAPVRSSSRRLISIVAIVLLVAAAGYWAWTARSAPDSGTAATGQGAGWKNSVAVLPFKDFSTNKDQEYFCDGMTDAIIGRISRLENLKVISMTSVMRYKDPDRDLKRIGRELGVQSIVEGSVQREGDRIRINAQLIDVDEDAHLWSQTFDRELISIFDIQDEISQAVAQKLQVQLLNDGSKAKSDWGTDNLEAYNAYVHGRFLWRKRTEQDLKSAVGYFEQAIKLDSNYALAWSGLADAWTVLPGYSSATNAEVLPKARVAAERAVALNDDLAEAHASLGLILSNENRVAEATREFERAIELNPGYVWTYPWYANLLEGIGQVEEGTRQLERALELDPLNTVTIVNLAAQKRREDKYDEAEKLFKRVLALGPNPLYGVQYAGFLVDLERFDEAKAQYREVINQFPTYSGVYHDLAKLYADDNKLDSARWVVGSYLARTNDTLTSLIWQGEFYQSIGKHQQAISEFTQAMRKYPEASEPLANLTSEYSNAEMFDSAMVFANRLTQLAPEDALSYQTRGSVFMRMGEFDRALSDFEQSLTYSPRQQWTIRMQTAANFFKGDFAKVRSLVAELNTFETDYVKRAAANFLVYSDITNGRLGAALTSLDKLIQTDSRDRVRDEANNRLQKVFLYEAIGQLDSAQKEIDSVVDLLRTNTDVLAWRDYKMQIMAERGHTEEAIRESESLKADVERRGQGRTIFGYYYGRGAIAFTQARFGEAIEYFERARDSVRSRESSDYFQIQYQVARAYLADKQYHRAIEEFEELEATYSMARLSSLVWVILGDFYLAQAYDEGGRPADAIRTYRLFLGRWGKADRPVAEVAAARQRLAALAP